MIRKRRDKEKLRKRRTQNRRQIGREAIPDLPENNFSENLLHLL